MFQLKPIHPDAIAAALRKVERYRLLNEPREAESICRDILAVDPDHQEALVMLVLSQTDQFAARQGHTLNAGLETAARLDGEFDRVYYEGLVYERWAKAQLERGIPSPTVFSWLREALGAYERAEAIATPGNDDAVLRWHASVRLIQSDAGLRSLEPSEANTRVAIDLPLE